MMGGAVLTGGYGCNFWDGVIGWGAWGHQSSVGATQTMKNLLPYLNHRL